VVAAAFVLIASPRVSAAPAPALVLSAQAVPGQIPGPGATVWVRGLVAHASTCQLEVLSSQSFPVVYSHNPKSCTNGDFSARVTVGPNSSTVARTVALALIARNAVSAYLGRFYVRLGPEAATAVLSARATPGAIPSAGATVTVSGRLVNATSCQLELLSRQSFPVVFSHDLRSCQGGTFLAHIVVGPNPTALPRTLAFELVARNPASWYAGRFYVRMAAAGQNAPRPAAKPGAPPVPQASIVPSSSLAVPVNAQVSSNWSGWAASGGPFTVAKGTFTAPATVAGAPGTSQVSEWVGLDGLSIDGSNFLIQAGVDAVPDPANPQGFDLQPWWEILPAQETNIDSVNVNPGDTVTVTLWRVSSTSWEINLTDDSNGQSFTSPPQSYAGPATSVDWVVEATTQCEASCNTAQLASFSPPIDFTGLGMTGAPPNSLYEIKMVQSGQEVSTPSDLARGSFSVTYTGPPH
ncbi:MAG TPA: G1 family glutamic endopeptidase, partial [Acidimicrobiales bacterium]|nr:G1 family glutamic endopeptidase [Acidimicrobiales bacterium]